MYEIKTVHLNQSQNNAICLFVFSIALQKLNLNRTVLITGGPIQKWTEIDIEIRTCDVILERVLEPQAIFREKKDLV